MGKTYLPYPLKCNSEEAQKTKNMENLFAGSVFCIFSSDEIFGAFLLLSLNVLVWASLCCFSCVESNADKSELL